MTDFRIPPEAVEAAAKARFSQAQPASQPGAAAMTVWVPRNRSWRALRFEVDAVRCGYATGALVFPYGSEFGEHRVPHGLRFDLLERYYQEQPQ